MDIKAENIIEFLDKVAPEKTACSWDNVGVMVGDRKKDIKKVLVALDCSLEVIKEGIEKNVDMIVTHHPFIFKPIKNLDYSNPLARKISLLIKNDILVYSAHTNLDMADFGTNDTLAKKIGLKNVEGLIPMGESTYMGKVGELEKEVKFSDFIDFIKNVLGSEHIVFNGKFNESVKKVGICTGAGADFEFMSKAKSMGCDVFITGDVGYHNAQIAEDLEIKLIDGTHYLTEVIVVESLIELLKKEFEEIEFLKSSVNGQTLNIV